MNTRIRKLAQDAGIKMAHDDTLALGYLDTAHKKFAELIINECIGVIHKEHDQGVNRHDDYCLALYEVYREIKQHFGVE
jgi:hemerythrin